MRKSILLFVLFALLNIPLMLFAQGGAQAGPGAGAGQQANQGSSNNKEDIQDADFEEVK